MEETTTIKIIIMTPATETTTIKIIIIMTPATLNLTKTELELEDRWCSSLTVATSATALITVMAMVTASLESKK